MSKEKMILRFKDSRSSTFARSIEVVFEGETYLLEGITGLGVLLTPKSSIDAIAKAGAGLVKDEITNSERRQQDKANNFALSYGASMALSEHLANRH